MRLLIYIFFIFFSFTTLSFSQVKAEHIVEKGENLYQISKKYNVTLSSIFEKNPQYEGAILNVGDIVLIPDSDQSINSQSNNQQSGIHTVVTGETKFGLSKKYQITIAELEADNPEIVPMLMVGQKLRIRNAENQTTNTVNVNNADLYLVKTGETLWGLSKRFNVTVGELERANSDLLIGVLKSGQYLRIPSNDSRSNMNNQRADVHIVKPGETKYGLSKKYNMSISELENLNPHIIKMLIVGHEVVISKIDNSKNTISKTTQESILNQNSDENIAVTKLPESESNIKNEIKNLKEVSNEVVDNKNDVTESTALAQTVSEDMSDGTVDISNNIDYVDYEIKSKETLFGLSKKAKMSQDEFLKLNPNLVTEGVKVGNIIKMPKNSLNDSQVASTKQNNSNVSSAIKLTDVKTISNTNTNFHDFSNLDKESTKTVVFLFDNDNQELEKNIAISEAMQLQKSYYQGVKLALDSLNNMGLKITPVFLNANANNKKTNGWKKSYKKGNLVVGPFEKENSLEMLKFSNEMSINTVIPIQVQEFSTDLNGIYSVPTEQHMKIFMMDYLTNLNGNIIIITDFIDSPEANFIRKYYPNVKFAPLDSRGNLNIERFKFLFENNVTNHVIMETDKSSLVITSTNYLLTEVNNYAIELALLKERSFLKSKEISDIRYKVLKLKFPSFEFETPKNSLLESKYKDLYQQDLTSNTILAFDVTMDAILRLFQLKSLDESLRNDVSKQTQTEFMYRKTQNHFWNSIIKVNQF